MTAAAPAAAPSGWIFSRPIDLLTFTGTAVVSLLLLLLAQPLGATPHEAPEWSWIVGVLLVDVAHVWSTIFVTYGDRHERRRRPWLYAAVPLGCYAIAFALYRAGTGPFWRAVAYLAAFHFVRQQYGWLMIYRARSGEPDRHGRILDGALIYATMLYPLIYWHAHLPRGFWWMKPGDFAAGLPAGVVPIAAAIYAALAIVYVGRALVAARRGRIAWGKHLLVCTTAACWYVGIVGTNSDYAFTVTNVFIHGVPYLVLIFFYGRRLVSRPESQAGWGAAILRRGLVPFLMTLWAIAYFEELLWDRTLWHERSYLFGSDGWTASLAPWLVPLLVTPQLAHYVLDAFLWRRAGNPRLAEILRP